MQLGGADPELLAQATKIAVRTGYDEVNLNVGCPSDRVQSGSFGAALMRDAPLVARCVSAMQDAAGTVPVTVKCRLGVDDQLVANTLPAFIETVAQAGVRAFTIHARKAWLEGLSPKENRDIPPLDYPLVVQMKSRFPELWIGINGGITDLSTAQVLLAQGLDGVMIGRAAYQRPSGILACADQEIFGTQTPAKSPEQVTLEMLPYIEAKLGQGARLNQITRHMLGLFAGRTGARAWRRHLSEHAHKPGADAKTVEDALALVAQRAA